jgi:intein/homing endonuclease
LNLRPAAVGNGPAIPLSPQAEIYNIAEKYLGGGQGEAHFTLDPAFLKGYKGKKPKFGFSGLGEFVFYRTYSRLKEDGSKETFLDVVQRVVEGCYEIQRRHCNHLHIPWTAEKAQASAQEMFQRMWDFKFLPPGRGLWMMGTKFMWERGSAALNNCLEFNTRIITRDGIKPIGELAGTTQMLMTSNGEWVDAPIRSFGRQKLMKIVLKRFRTRKVIYATPDHRWFARPALNRIPAGVDRDERLRHIRRKGPFQETLTRNLEIGHELQMVYGQGVQSVRPSQFGIAHGICFGDGTLGHKDKSTGSYLYLCGKKNFELLEFFSKSPTSFDPRKGKEGAIRVADLPRHYKSPPDLRECKAYLYGWLAGYFAADGSINKKACTAFIHSSKQENMELVREVCAVLGIGTGLVQQGMHVVNHRGDRREFVGYRVYLKLEHLTEDFFLLSHHRQRFLAWKERGGSHREKWIVESVEETDREEEVYCATVPGKGCFVLEDNILTGNCLPAEEEIVTRDGIKPIGELAGTVQTLLTEGGRWVEAPIKSFGVQQLWKITLERSGSEKIIYATADHEWYARDRRFAPANHASQSDGVSVAVITAKRRRTAPYRICTTKDLKPGVDCLRYLFGRGIGGELRPSNFGIAHGITYGDGNTPAAGHSGASIYLCGHKDRELLKYFNSCPTTDHPDKCEGGAVRVADLPRFFKEPPSLRESSSYLYGWLAGYFAADGKINKKGNCIRISSSKKSNLLVVRDVCAVLGIGTYSIIKSHQVVKHDGEVKTFDSYEIGLMGSHLRPEFFLLKEHRRRFESWSSHRTRPVYHWRVKSVEPTDRYEEVFCPQVPDYHSFALADGIHSRNCGFVSTSDLSESDPAEPFCFLMDMSMLGVGVGFDTKGAGKINIYQPNPSIIRPFVIPDSREGWVDSVRHLIRSYTVAYKEGIVEFDYSQIRKEGSDIKGFGGKASGPSILIELHVLIRAHLDRKIGQTLDSVDITDLMNYIGRCVVAGNVRRCLPKGTLVHLKRGLVPIEQVQVGDLVLTADGYYPVAENVAQGVQRVVTINSLMGPFRCTDRHRIAVMSGLDQYEWKRAHELRAGDRMVFVDAVIPGTDTVLPGYSDLSGRGSTLIVPGLTTDVAWFLGAVHGGGYVYPGRAHKGRKYHGASVTIPVNRDEYHDGITAKVNAGFAAFGFDAPGEQRSQDNCRKIRVISKRLAHYLYTHVKQARKPLDVPACIRMGIPEIRSAYLAGLLDSDGSTKNRPTTLVTSVYRDFLRQVQAVYSSLGIPTKLRLRKKADAAGQAKWEISLLGEYAIAGFRQHVQPHAVKQLREMGRASGHDFGYPTEMVSKSVMYADYGRTWTPQQEQMTYSSATTLGLKTKGLIPVAVTSVVDEGVTVETYDLSVPDRSEFVAEGRLVHNTAEIAFGDADDEAYCSMKNPTKTLLPQDMDAWFEVTGKIYAAKRNSATKDDFAGKDIPDERLLPAIQTWNALNHHRWASNNSIFAKLGMDYRPVGQQIGVNGEPGIIWLNNVRDYGRMVDGLKPGVDGRVMGANPCFAGAMRLLTENGYRTMRELWVSGGFQEYSGQPSVDKHGTLRVVNHAGVVTATNVYRTSERAEIFRVMLSNGQYIDATADHVFVVLDDDMVEHRVRLCELVPGHRLPLHFVPAFGQFSDPHYAELAGWVIGDGSLSQQRDGQVTAFVACHQDDIEEVLPVLRRNLLDVYHRHNQSSDQSPDFDGSERRQEHFSHRQKSIRSNVLGRLLNSDGVVPGDKHRVPTSIWGGTRETVAAFLRGFFSADGGVQISNYKLSISIRAGQKSKSFLNECQLLLRQFGINSSVLRRQAVTTRLMNDGNGGHELIISGRTNVQLFMNQIGFIQASKTEKATSWLADHHGSRNSLPKLFAMVMSVERVGEEETFCLTEPGHNKVVVNGIIIGQCMEQSLESYELCVSGDTKLQLRDGIRRIDAVVGKIVEVWNGDSWSKVTPRVTGSDRELYRVHFSDGSYLDATGNHGWSVRPVGKRVYRRVGTLQLQPGDRVLGFSLGRVAGNKVSNAFEMGYATGDGDLVNRPRYTRPMAVACGQKAKLKTLDMGGRWYKPQNKDGYGDPYNRINLRDCMTSDQLRELRDKNAGLPAWVMAFDRESILEFIAGWIESDGCVCKQANTHSYRIYGLEAKIRDAQLLLRRAGINHASVNFYHPAGQVTNKGVRQNDLWYIQIPSFECGEIPTRVKRATKIGSRIKPNPRYSNRGIDVAQKQYVVAVEKLPGLHTTYCFDEPDNHMGVFGNVITYQCNLVETFPSNHDDANDYMRTLKFAYLYAKTVTLLPTHNRRTNQVTLRNRRIGLSQSGIVEAFAKFGRRTVLKDFCDAGYNEIRRWDQIYSEWMCVPKSIKVTSVKPSGCRPWHALTTTSAGLLTLEELFEMSGHQDGERWCDMTKEVIAVQGDGIDSSRSMMAGVATAIGDRITKTYDNGLSDVVKVKLNYNFMLESTPNHQWFVVSRYDRGKKRKLSQVNDWKRADELLPGDIVQLTPGIYSCRNHAALCKLSSRHVSMRGPVAAIEQPTHMNPDLAWLLGYMWGDGSQSFLKFRMRYTDQNLSNLHKAQRVILEQFGVETKITRASQGRDAFVLEVGSKLLWHWLLINDCLKIKSNADLIPKCIRSSSYEDILAFLAGLCDSDGCIGRRASDQYPIISMSGDLFARHVQDVALAVGLVFSRSLNAKGRNHQGVRRMWSLSGMKHTVDDRFALFAKHCNKCVEDAVADLPWTHQVGKKNRLFGKVVAVTQGERQRTYDVEVDNSHWYYAGAVKSHNTVSLVVGVSPGIHHPEAGTYWRLVRVAKDSVLVKILREAGFKVEPVLSDPDRTVVVYFGVKGESGVRPVGEVSIWEQMQNAVDYQRYWADNQVSCTVKFKPHEAADIARVLEAFEDQLKGISFLPHVDHGYAQAPYIPCEAAEVEEYNSKLGNADYSEYLYEAVGSQFCDNDKCAMPT